jgi:hypothetical protein
LPSFPHTYIVFLHLIIVSFHWWQCKNIQKFIIHFRKVVKLCDGACPCCETQCKDKKTIYVCGKDGKSYKNKCMAHCLKKHVKCTGQCPCCTDACPKFYFYPYIESRNMDKHHHIISQPFWNVLWTFECFCIVISEKKQ